MFSIQFILDSLQADQLEKLRCAYEDNQLKDIKWSWVTRKNPNISIEEIYQRITGNTRPTCITCKINQVSSFISFEKGYSKYCSKSCAKHDPLVEQKKKSSLDKNPNWKSLAQAKLKETNRKKYGTDFAMQSADVIGRRKVTNSERYGSSEVLSSSSSIRRQLTNEIARNKFMTRVSTLADVEPLFDASDFIDSREEYPWRCKKCNHHFTSSSFCGDAPICQKCNPRSSSRGEREIFYFVSSILDCEIKSRFKVNGVEIDIYVPSKKVGIEFNGIYWHSEGKGTSPEYHLRKKEKCEEAGITLLQFWDVEWIKKPEIIKSIISNHLGLSQKVFARNCKVVELAAKDAKDFLNTNHLSGSANGDFFRLGLVNNNKIVAVATFSKPRFKKNKSEEVELLRLCTITGLTVVGGAAKLISNFISINPNVKIISSYCNDRVFSGRVYQNLGFRKINNGKPAAWYFASDGILRHRMGFQKKLLLQRLGLEHSDKTEWELAQDLKLNRVWDCGSSKWQLDVAGHDDQKSFV